MGINSNFSGANDHMIQLEKDTKNMCADKDDVDDFHGFTAEDTTDVII